MSCKAFAILQNYCYDQILLPYYLFLIPYLFLSQKSILVMKTALFKLLNQTIIPCYATKLQYKIPK